MNRRGFLAGLAAAVAGALAPLRARALSSAPMVDAANQIGSQIIITPAPRGFQVGDIITFDGVDGIDWVTKEPNGRPREFVVTAETPINGRVLAIYPPLVPKSLDRVDGLSANVATTPRNRARVNRNERLSNIVQNVLRTTPWP